MKKYQAQFVVGFTFEATEHDLEHNFNPSRVEKTIEDMICYFDAVEKQIAENLNSRWPSKIDVSVTYETTVEE